MRLEQDLGLKFIILKTNKLFILIMFQIMQKL